MLLHRLAPVERYIDGYAVLVLEHRYAVVVVDLLLQRGIDGYAVGRQFTGDTVLVIALLLHRC